MNVSNRVTLPVGIEKDGVRYREVVVDEMKGVDEEGLSNPRHKENFAGAQTELLQRCILEVPGMMPRKADPFHNAPITLVRGMFSADRDALMLAIRMLTFGPMMTLSWRCDKCTAVNDDEVDLTTLQVVEWPADKAPEIEFDLPRGIEKDGKVHKLGRLRFPKGTDAEVLAKQVSRDPGVATTSMLAMLIMDVEGLKPDRVMVQRMSVLDRGALGDAFRESLPGVRMETNTTCSRCGEETERTTIGLNSFFARTART